MKIPDDYHQPIVYSIASHTENHRDAEKALIHVLENRIYVTKTRAIYLKPGGQSDIDLAKVINVESETAAPDRLLIDLTTNPTWYAIKALPYLMDFPHDCSEQVFNRLYAHTLGQRIILENPAIKDVIMQWNEEALSSNLSKDAFLKSASLEETPWVSDALSETDQMLRLATYFQGNIIRHGIQKNLTDLSERQSPSGGFSWFPGGREHWYITQYILEGLLNIAGWLDDNDRMQVNNIIKKATTFVDNEAIFHLRKLSEQVEAKHARWEDDHLDPIIIHYLYVRSLSSEPINDKVREVFDYYLKQLDRFWINKSIYSQALIAQVSKENGKSNLYEDIIKSFKERMIRDDNLGAHWNYSYGFNWWQLPIETHSKLINVFEDHGDINLVEELKIWLLNNKRTNRWETTKSTADAIQALLGGTQSWIAPSRDLLVDFAGANIERTSSPQAGSLYTRYQASNDELKKLTQMKLENPNPQPAWGGIFYQYFEDLDKVSASANVPSGLQLQKKYFIEDMTPKGKVLVPIEKHNLQPGMTIVVQLEFSSDQDMEFVHLQDFRGASLEPKQVLSGYNWNGALSYFQSNSDVATNFFMEYLPRGKYIIQYSLLVNQVGDFSAGNAKIQSMYAPEYQAYTKGTRISIADQLK